MIRHGDRTDGTLLCTQAAADTPGGVIQNFRRRASGLRGKLYIKRLCAAQIDTEHAKAAEASVEEGFRSFFPRHRGNTFAITSADTADGTGHTAHGTVPAPDLVDFVNRACRPGDGRYGTDIPAGTASGTRIENSVSHF